MELTTIEYIAQSLNKQNAIKKGRKTCALWCTLDERTKQRYLRKAKKLVSDWVDIEVKAEKKRKAFLKQLNK